MSDTREQLEAMVAGALDSMPHADCEMCAEYADVDDHADPSNGRDAYSWAERQLDAWATARVTPNAEPDIRAVTVLVTFGGPNVEVTWDAASELVTAEGWWGSDHVTRTLFGIAADAFAAWASDYAEGLTL